MAKIVITTVDQYIESQPAATRVVLETVRSAIRAALPGAEEVISYRIPAFALRGVRVIYMAGWKRHYSIYPAGERMLEIVGHELAACEVTKGTIKFPLSEPVPVELIQRIARLRADEVVRFD